MTSPYTVVETPALAPGECWITRTPIGPFIDTNIDVPFERRGRVYLSKDVVREMAFEFGLFEGLVPATEVEEAYANGLRDGVKENLGGNVDDLVAGLDRAAARLRALRVDAEAPVEAATS